MEPYTEPVPVFPTAHYGMGGIPTNIRGEVLANATDVIPGLYAAGETACVSVHGGNRLGTNSLLDINVFGRRAGIAAAEHAAEVDLPELPEGVETPTVELLERLRDRPATEDRIANIRTDLQELMDANVQVFRTEETCRTALAGIKDLKKRYETVAIQDKGRRYNLDLMEAVELGFLLDLAEIVALGALHRKESRGGHFREDFEKRDDVNYLEHTMAYRTLPGEEGVEGTPIRLGTKPVVITRYEPKERTF